MTTKKSGVLKNTPTKRLKRVAAPKKKGDIPTPIRVRFGTRNEMGPEHRFPTEAKAKAKMTLELKAWTAWCQRYNNEGLKVIADALTQVDTVAFHRQPERIECAFDTRYEMRLVIEYWREDA